MVDINQIRQAQERRRLPALKAWDDANKRLEEALACVKAREQEFHEVSEDVRQKLSALDLVTSLARGMESETAATNILGMESNRPKSPEPADPQQEARQSEAVETSEPGLGRLVRKSSRSLFPNMRRSA